MRISPVLTGRSIFMSPVRKSLEKKDMLWQELCTWEGGGAGSWGDSGGRGFQGGTMSHQ